MGELTACRLRAGRGWPVVWAAFIRTAW